MRNATLKSVLKLQQSFPAVTDRNFVNIGRFINNSYWDDLRAPATQGRRGALNKPDFDYTNLGLLMPESDEAEKVYFIQQLPHAWKEESNIHPHVHFIQTSANVPRFKMDYRWYNLGESSVASFTTLLSGSTALPYTSGTIQNLVAFPEIDGTGKLISSILDIIIYRTTAAGTEVSGDVLLKEYDTHYQVDGWGSFKEYLK